jgi:hypothetical protein
MNTLILAPLLGVAPLALALIVPDLADPVANVVRLAAVTITDSFWASALFALVLFLAYASSQNAEQDRR